jgi:hypothetical protein
MASAILLFYTSDGFLITADGRARINGTVSSDTTTKIFNIAEPNRSLAYAFGHSVALTDKDDSGIILFDFRDEAVQAIKSLKKTWYDDLPTYAKQLAKRLQNKLERARKNERIEPLKEDPTGLVAFLLLAGYYVKRPSAVMVEFRHKEQILLPPSITPLKLDRGYKPLMTYGSEKVRQHIFDADTAEFSTYRVSRANVEEKVTLSEVADVASKYILACSDPAAIEIDAEHCAGIGGHIHTARVTQDSGFEWVVPPVTASST